MLQTKVLSITIPKLVTLVEMSGLVSCGAFWHEQTGYVPIPPALLLVGHIVSRAVYTP